MLLFHLRRLGSPTANIIHVSEPWKIQTDPVMQLLSPTRSPKDRHKILIVLGDTQI